MVLTYGSLMSYDIEHLFLSLFVVHMSSLQKCFFMSLFIFSCILCGGFVCFGFFVLFLLLSFESCLYILNTCSLLDMRFEDILPLSVPGLFDLLAECFAKPKFSKTFLTCAHGQISE